jgi:hypothetical protein
MLTLWNYCLLLDDGYANLAMLKFIIERVLFSGHVRWIEARTSRWKFSPNR